MQDRLENLCVSNHLYSILNSYLSIYLSICLSIYVSIHLFIYLFIHPPFSRINQDHMMLHELSEREILRPGMTRLSFPYFMSQEPIDYVIEAIIMIAQHGWKLLPQVGHSKHPHLFYMY